MKALATLQQLPATKAEINQFSEVLINEILSGEVNPLEVDVLLKAVEETIKSVRKNSDVQYAIVNEAEKYDKTFDFKGALINKSSRTTYDYSGCNDQTLADLIFQQEQLKEQIEIRQAQLKSGIDINTGEALTKPTTKVSEFLTIKFK